jgi:hypothetical protein
VPSFETRPSGAPQDEGRGFHKLLSRAMTIARIKPFETEH